MARWALAAAVLIVALTVMLLLRMNASPPGAGAGSGLDHGSDLGSMSPDAPPQTAQFAFLVGAHDCTEQRRSPQDGEWREATRSWDGEWILNGHAIQDGGANAEGTFAATNVRVFDAERGVWRVTWFSAPGHATGVWEGGREGDEMVVRRAIPQGSSRLTFHNVTDSGFQWRGEIVPPEGEPIEFWRVQCRRLPDGR